MAPTLRIPVAAALMLLCSLSLLTSAAAQTGGVSFAPAITFPTVLYASSITAGDLNHDSKADLGVAAATGDDQFACIALHVPFGAYLDWVGEGWSPTDYNCGLPYAGYPGSILFADANLDGNLDVITTDQEWIDIVIAFGNGQGQFSYGDDVILDFVCGDNTPAQAAVADMNADGSPDIVAIYSGYRNAPGCVAVFLGKGGGEFAPPLGTSSGGDEPFDFAVGDLNNDGMPDLAIANYGGAQGVTGNLAVLLGKGDGTFEPPTIYSAPPDEYFPLVILADFNRDGNLDLAFTDYHTLRVALGNGDGTFARPLAHRVHDGPGHVAAADLNGDGILDLVSTIATEQGGGVAVLLGDGDGTFQRQVDYKTDVNPAIAIGDFNGDGKPDIATVNGNSTLSILLNTTPWPKSKK